MSGAEINTTVRLRQTDWKIKRIMRPRHLLPAGFGITIALITNLCGQPANDLWQVYQTVLRKAKYIGLTHTITPTIPVWKGFGPSKFAPTVNPENGQPYNYNKDRFSATAYQLSTDQLGTQLDPPAHWNPDFPSIDELPATFAVRPLVVISIVDKVAKNPKYALQVEDILDWEKKHGKIPEASVVFIRCDWSKKWPAPSLATDPNFPGVSLSALKFLHLQRRILFHGHEPLDTDTKIGIIP